MRAKNISKLAAALFLIGGAAAFGPGCGPSSGSFCDKICDCTGCSEVERTDCVDSVDDAQKAANDEGCNDQYNAYFSCMNSELSCTAGVLDADGCDAEIDAVSKCMGSFIGFGVNGCEYAINKLIAKYESCDIQVDPTGMTECTAADEKLLLCYLPCIENASCAAIKGEVQDQEYIDCVVNCQQ